MEHIDSMQVAQSPCHIERDALLRWRRHTHGSTAEGIHRRFATAAMYGAVQ